LPGTNTLAYYENTDRKSFITLGPEVVGQLFPASGQRVAPRARCRHIDVVAGGGDGDDDVVGG
jgi:hypothetical protein